MKVLILYHTKTGHTLEAADAVAEGIRSSGSTAHLVSLGEFSPEGLSDYGGFIVASPCWTGSLTPDGVAFPVSKVLKDLSPGALAGLKCGGISVHSGIGGETTVGTIGRLLSEKGCQAFAPGPVARAGVPFSLWRGPSVRSEDEERFAAYGAEFAS